MVSANGVDPVQALGLRDDPYTSRGILGDVADDAFNGSVGRVWNVAEMGKTPVRRIEAVHTGFRQAYPQEARCVHMQGRDDRATQAVRLFMVVLVLLNRVSIVAIEPVPGARPDETLLVLDNALHPFAREAVFARDAVELHALVDGLR